MKHLIFICVMISMAPLSGAQTKEELSMADVLFRGGVAARKLEMELGYQVIRMEFDRISDVENSYRYLSTDVTYRIIAMGDYRVRRVRMRIYKNVSDCWNLIESDDGNDIGSTVSYRPLEDGLYKFNILVDLNDGYKSADYCLIVATK